MNAMGHQVRNYIGVDLNRTAKSIQKQVPGYMPMGTGSAMAGMQMQLPDNTLPMMSGNGPFGPIEMGGMFTVVKIREGLARDDYRDPGPYQHPPGTVAYEVDAPATEPARQEGPAAAKPPPNDRPAKPARMKGMKM